MSTLVLVEQTVAVDPTRLGEIVDRLGLDDMAEVEHALRVVLGLSRR